MTVEILTDPNTGGHKINVKGWNFPFTPSLSSLECCRCDEWICEWHFFHSSPPSHCHVFDCQWWQPMTCAGRLRAYSGPLWRSTSSDRTSATRRGSLLPSPRTTAGPRNLQSPSSCMSVFIKMQNYVVHMNNFFLYLIIKQVVKNDWKLYWSLVLFAKWWHLLLAFFDSRKKKCFLSQKQ